MPLNWGRQEEWNGLGRSLLYSLCQRIFLNEDQPFLGYEEHHEILARDGGTVTPKAALRVHFP